MLGTEIQWRIRLIVCHQEAITLTTITQHLLSVSYIPALLLSALSHSMGNLGSKQVTI